MREILSVIWDCVASLVSGLHVVKIGSLVNNFSTFSGQITDTAHIVFDIIQARHWLVSDSDVTREGGAYVILARSRCVAVLWMITRLARSLITESSYTVVEKE